MNSNRNSNVLSDRMQITCGRLHATYHRFWRHQAIGDLLPSFLILMHQIVRASVPLMKVAQSLASERAGRDLVCRQLVDYLAVHIEEEDHHDEWLLEDLEAVDLMAVDVLSRLPSPNVASLVGAQYYWIQHHHPVALLGYMRLLEGNAPSASHIEALQSRSGLPTRLFRTYEYHGVHDPNHLQDLDLFLDSLSLSESQADLIWVSASHTARVLASCLEDIEDNCLAVHEGLGSEVGQ